MSQMKKSSILKSFTTIDCVKVSLPYTNEIYLELLNEFWIIHLFYHRNKNQHRVAKWWSFLDILHRHLRKILLLMEDINEIIKFRRLSTIKFNSNKKSFIKINEFPSMKNKKIIKRITQNRKKIKIEKNLLFHNKLNDNQAISLINKKLSLLIKQSKYLFKKIIPNSYWIFMGVVELGQFTNIGFVLIGFISKLYNLLSKIDGIDINIKFQKIINNSTNNIKMNQQQQLIKENDDDLGEVIELNDVESVENSIKEYLKEEEEEEESTEKEKKEEEKDEDIINAPLKKKSKSNNIMDDLFGSAKSLKKEKVKDGKDLKKKKKKKSNNAIDDIFGF